MVDKRESRKTRVGYSLPHEGLQDIPGEPTQPDAAHPAPLQLPRAPLNPSPQFTPANGLASPNGMAGANAFPATDSTVTNRAPPLEVEYIRDTDATMQPGSVVVLEIWTRNRIYHVDANMTCVDVINRASGAAETHHTLKGTRLTGGQRRSKSTMAIEIVVPYPVPGTEAVFKHPGKRGAQYGQTSTVERVVLKMRKLVVGAVAAEPAWEEITGRFQIR